MVFDVKYEEDDYYLEITHINDYIAPKVVRERLKIILDIIKDLEKEYENKVPIDILRERLINEWGIGEKSFKELTDELLNKGLIFKHTDGYFKKI